MTAKWKQLTCPSADGWVNKTCSIVPVECDSAMRRDGALTPATTWASLENTMLSERRRAREAPRCGIPLTGNVQNQRAHRDSSDQGPGVGGMGVDQGSLWRRDGNVLELDRGSGGTTT